MGVGRLLKKAQIIEANRIGYHAMVAEVLSTNIGGISLNLKFGYRIVGEILEAGYRNRMWIGLVILQKLLSNKP